MAIAGKALKAISEYGDDAVRAAAEFGDDSVRSLLGLDPAMRERLAALASRQLDVARARSSKYSGNKSTGDITRSVAKSISSLFETAPKTGNVSALPRLVESARTMDPLRADFLEPTKAKMARFVDSLSYERPVPSPDLWSVERQLTVRRPIDELKAISEADARKKDALTRLSQTEEDIKAFDPNFESPYAVERLASVREEASQAAKNYEDIVLGIATEGKIPNRLTETQNRLQDLAEVFRGESPNSVLRLGPSNVVPAINQARLLALLRMVGDAQ